MTDLTHCDGPGCDSTSANARSAITNAAGQLLMGWYHLNAGDYGWDFHDATCLKMWAAEREQK